jgi:hypothetical protein
MKFREGEDVAIVRNLGNNSGRTNLDRSQLAEIKRILPGIENLARHPVFEIAEQTPVFLINGKVYSAVEGTPQDRENSGNYSISCPEFSKGQFLKTGDTINRIVHSEKDLKIIFYH